LIVVLSLSAATLLAPHAGVIVDEARIAEVLYDLLLGAQRSSEFGVEHVALAELAVETHLLVVTFVHFLQLLLDAFILAGGFEQSLDLALWGLHVDALFVLLKGLEFLVNHFADFFTQFGGHVLQVAARIVFRQNLLEFGVDAVIDATQDGRILEQLHVIQDFARLVLLVLQRVLGFHLFGGRLLLLKLFKLFLQFVDRHK